MNWKAILLPSAYLAFFILSAFAILWWDRSKRGRRIPFARDLRLTRTAGETQLKAVTRADEDFIFLVTGAGLAPCLVGLLLLLGVARLQGWWQIGGLVAVAAIFLAAFALALRWFVARLKERSDRYLGYFGERMVAECLEPLKAQGWRIFHDVPCESGREKFNIDHVAVGPGGVFAIETKTRRKGGAREGRDDYKVFFDGEQLSWPWGEDQEGIGQAIGNAKWLQHWLEKTTGQKTEAVPVLALPGWYVEASARSVLRVVNPTWLPGVLTGGAEPVLNEKQIDLSARQLEQRCRDVGY
ncbi:MAG: nuclease-related domain-containing protein [Opitutaceae bacterium]|nr:nuclease-related domain-containing protein [Opitutaceae bacterium]